MALTPVSSSERIPSLDVLRGLALYGVLTANLVWLFSGIELLPPGKVAQTSLAGFYMGMFVSGRAITTLTFLFGLGFALQLARAEAHGDAPRAVLSRRLLAMLLFGAAHVLLLWWGDVLWIYGLTGFALLWFRRVRPRWLVVWGLALIFVPRVIAHIPAIREAISSVVPQPASPLAFNAEMLAALSEGDRAAMTWVHLRKLVYHIGPTAVWFFPWVLGHFLLGMAAAKARVFERDAADYRRMFRWLIVAGVAIAVIGTVVMMSIRQGRAAYLARPAIVRIGLNTLHELVTLGVAGLYVSAVALLMRRRMPRALLAIFAPVGRMPLTTYLSQSLFSTFVFYGWGLGWIGEVSVSEAIGIAAGIFAVQVVIANLWLRRFRSGPMEWLWRAITYRRGGATSPAGRMSATSPP